MRELKEVALDEQRWRSRFRWIFIAFVLTSLFTDAKGRIDDSASWPWQVLITRKGNTPEQTLDRSNLRGGGSLLNKKWVLTAAHVVLSSNSISSLVICIGVTARPMPGEKIDKSIQMFAPTAKYIHLDYSSTTGLNNIALLKIGARFGSSMALLQDDTVGVTYSHNAKPVFLPCVDGRLSDDQFLLKGEKSRNVLNTQSVEKCLREEKRLFKGGDVVVTGFGHLQKWDGSRDLTSPHRYLQQASLTVGDKETCRKGIRDINNKTRHHTKLMYSEKLLCTISNKTTTCAGDSGGPLVRKMTHKDSTRSRWVQIGIINFSLKCAFNYPVYYTKVAQYINWIKETIEHDNEQSCHSPPGKPHFFRIVGGTDAAENIWPWQVLIAKGNSTPEQTLSKYDLHGGGSLLNKKWVLTAAHVVQSPIPLSSLVILVGVFNRETLDRNVQMFAPAAKYIHADFSGTTGWNDIALLKLGARFSFSMTLQNDTSGVTYMSNAKPVHLPCADSFGVDYSVDKCENTRNISNRHSYERCFHEEKRLIKEKDVVVTGFGSVLKYDCSEKSSPIYPNCLRQASLSLGDEETCRKGIRDINNAKHTKLSYSETLICTISNTSDACQGDSGGPLVRKMTDSETGVSRWIQIGIVSYGCGCLSGYPGYYTNVIRYINWINETIQCNYDRSDEAESTTAATTTNAAECADDTKYMDKASYITLWLGMTMINWWRQDHVN